MCLCISWDEKFQKYCKKNERGKWVVTQESQDFILSQGECVACAIFKANRVVTKSAVYLALQRIRFMAIIQCSLNAVLFLAGLTHPFSESSQNTFKNWYILIS